MPGEGNCLIRTLGVRKLSQGGGNKGELAGQTGRGGERTGRKTGGEDYKKWGMLNYSGKGKGIKKKKKSQLREKEE